MDGESAPDFASSGQALPDDPTGGSQAVIDSEALAITQTAAQGDGTVFVPGGSFQFDDLPYELKMEIWEYLRDDEADSTTLDQNFFFDMRIPLHRFPNRFPNPYAAFIKTSMRVYKNGGPDLQFATRRAMMGVCRLSRKYALEAWKKDLEGIVTNLGGFSSNDRFWVNGTKESLVKMLDARIKGLIRRMNGEA